MAGLISTLSPVGLTCMTVLGVGVSLEFCGQFCQDVNMVQVVGENSSRAIRLLYSEGQYSDVVWLQHRSGH